MSAPTKEQLDRYMDLVVGGEAEEDAIAVIWGDDEEPEPPKPKKPTVMVTEFPDGVIIGWDHCSALNGGCGKSVTKCECKDGRPKELAVFKQWRDGAKQMPDYSKAARAAKAAGVPNVDPDATGTGVVVATDTEALSGQVACVLGQHFAPLDESDQNDDETYSCWKCQEKGLQRERSDA